MAAAQGDHHHGDMEIAQQESTFSAFMRITVWSSGLLAMTLVFLTLTFTTPVHWFPALVVAGLLGLVIGFVLGMKAAWYAAVTGLGALAFAGGVLYEIVSRFV